jgi:hypothetical protein
MALPAGVLLWGLLRSAEHAPAHGRAWWTASAAALSACLVAAGFAHLSRSPGLASAAMVAFAAAWTCGVLACHRAAAWFGGARRWQRVVVEVVVLAGLTTYAAGWSASAPHPSSGASATLFGLSLTLPGVLNVLLLGALLVTAAETWLAFGTLRAAVKAALVLADAEASLAHG